MRAARLVVVFACGGAVAGLLGACGLVSGAEDLSFRDCLEGCTSPEGGSMDAREDRSVAITDAKAAADAKAEGGADGFAPPSFCTGLVAVIPFDQTPAVFGAPGLVDSGAYDPDPGKFGQSFDIGPSSFAEYAVGPNALRLSLDEGTLAFWIQPDAQLCSPARAYVQTLPSGPAVTCDAPYGARIAGATPATAITTVDGGGPKAGYVRVATTWAQSPKDGAPSLTLTVDGTPIAPAVTASWSAGAATTLRVGQPPGGLGRIDDLGIWTRALTPAELIESAASTVSLLDACGLR